VLSSASLSAADAARRLSDDAPGALRSIVLSALPMAALAETAGGEVMFARVKRLRFGLANRAEG
jgi:hypothetical protein